MNERELQNVKEHEHRANQLRAVLANVTSALREIHAGHPMIAITLLEQAEAKLRASIGS